MARRRRRRPRRKSVSADRKNPLTLDQIFCRVGKEVELPKLMLKAVATVESALDSRAYRFEQGFWDRYLADNPAWSDRPPREVSASYGLMQVMYVVAHEAGWRGRAEELYDPLTNVRIGATVLKKWFDHALENQTHVKYGLAPMMVALACYNGGRGGNPGPDGKLRNQEYADKAFDVWQGLMEKEDECFDK